MLKLSVIKMCEFCHKAEMVPICNFCWMFEKEINNILNTFRKKWTIFTFTDPSWENLLYSSKPSSLNVLKSKLQFITCCLYPDNLKWASDVMKETGATCSY